MIRYVIATLAFLLASQAMADNGEAVQVKMTISLDGTQVAEPSIATYPGYTATVEIAGKYRIEVLVSDADNNLYDTQFAYSDLSPESARPETNGFELAEFKGVALGRGGSLTFPHDEGTYLLSFKITRPDANLVAETR